MGKYNFEFDLSDDNTLTWIADEITDGASVLEFGAANGRLTKYLSMQKQCAVDIVEIDAESGMEAASYARSAYVGDTEGDIEKYYWLESGQKYDYIIFADVLEHLVNPQNVLKRCKRVIAEKGKILVSVPNVAHNAIILDLLKDKFEYRSVGLLDNTHLRFFTRTSFIQMANWAGWTVIQEKSKMIRVGETELDNSYNDVPKEVYKFLVNRDNGDVYQYMFALALNDEYVQSIHNRIVSLDTNSHYDVEIMYSNEGSFSYHKSVSRPINPFHSELEICLPVLLGNKCARLKLLNCNCIVKALSVFTTGANGSKVEVEYKHNGESLGDILLFLREKPIIDFSLPQDTTDVCIRVNVLDYDFENCVYDTLLEFVLNAKETLQESINTYEAMIKRKDSEFLESVNTYEAMIKRKDSEFLKSVNDYELMLQKKTEDYQLEVNSLQKETEEVRTQYELLEQTNKELKKQMEELVIQLQEKQQIKWSRKHGKN